MFSCFWIPCSVKRKLTVTLYTAKKHPYQWLYPLLIISYLFRMICYQKSFVDWYLGAQECFSDSWLEFCDRLGIHYDFLLNLTEYRLLFSGNLQSETLQEWNNLANKNYLYYYYQKFTGKEIDLHISSCINWTNIYRAPSICQAYWHISK